jgi:AraC-like DNA-binding protein
MIVVALAWAAIVLALVVAGVMAARARTERRRTAALLVRLDDLQARLDAAPHGADATPGAVPSPPPGHPEPTPSGDVLAGLTSRVVRLVSGSGEEAGTLAEQAIRCIHQNLDRGLTANRLAEELHVSLRTLERGLLLALECTPRQLILAMKMREARRLLLGGRLLVKEVAFRLGFGDQYHFSRCFKSFYHVAPSVLRPTPPVLR